MLLLMSIAASAWAADVVELRVDGDFPGGNIVVERMTSDTVYLRQDLRDTAGWWFHWSFRVRGAAGRTLRFQFAGRSPIGVRGPAASTDGGGSWSWLGAAIVKGAGFSYSFASDANDVRFCFAIPYQESNLKGFLASHKNNPRLKVEELCKSRKGRSVERLRVGCLDREPTYRILLTARHHACETVANYALEGILEAALADSDDGRWFRENVEALAIPFMDKDGVEDGDQGKNRRPHDHNRDYLGESIYPSVAALREFVPKWSGDKPRIVLDLHCPYISGGNNEQIFFVGGMVPRNWENAQRFSRVLARVRQGPLTHDPKHNYPWGQGWNNDREPRSCGKWAERLSGVSFGATLEIPYANVGGAVVTPAAARALGGDLARAIRVYLTEPPERGNEK